jgi:hypothetical protein
MWFELLKIDITADDIVEMPDEAAERAKELLDSIVRDSPYAKWIDSNQISLTPNWLPISYNELLGYSGYSMGVTWNNVGVIYRKIKDNIGVDALRIIETTPRRLGRLINEQMHMTEIIVGDDYHCINYSVTSTNFNVRESQQLIRPEVYPIHIQGCFRYDEQEGNLPIDDYRASLVLAAREKSTWVNIWKDV